MTSTTKAVTSKPQVGALKAYVTSHTGTSLEYYNAYYIAAIYPVASALLFHKICCPAAEKVEEVKP